MAAVAARRTGGQTAFGRDTLDDPAIARLRHAVRLEPYAPIETWPKDRPGRVTWRLSDGETWTEAVENARGGEDEPFSTDELLGKIDELTRAVFPAHAGVLRELRRSACGGGETLARCGHANDEAMRLRCRPMLMCWWWAQARADLLPRLLRMMPASAVAIIEKLDRPGGNSSLSTGSVPAAGTRFQREAGTRGLDRTVRRRSSSHRRADRLS